MAYIYKITNNINKKSYIGKTTRTPQERFEEHRKEAKRESQGNIRYLCTSST